MSVNGCCVCPEDGDSLPLTGTDSPSSTTAKVMLNIYPKDKNAKQSKREGGMKLAEKRDKDSLR